MPLGVLKPEATNENEPSFFEILMAFPRSGICGLVLAPPGLMAVASVP